MTEQEREKRLKFYIRFLKDKDAYNKYLEEYYRHPNEYNTGNVVTDLRKTIESIHTLNYISPLYHRIIGWNWSGSIYHPFFWDKIAKEMNKILKNTKF